MESEFPSNPNDPESSEIVPAPFAASDAELSEQPWPLQPPPRLWGPWATIGWTLLCVLVILIAQLIGFIIFAIIMTATNRSLKLDDLGTNGNVLTVATLLSTPAAVGLIVLLIWVRSYPIRDYLALYWPSQRSFLLAFAGLAVLLIATDLISYLLGRPLVPEVMVDVYRTAWLPGLFLALVVLAPLGEETLFRGFLYQGIAASRAGPIVAIIVSSAAFAVLHVQYDWYGIVAAAATGVYLGVVRYRAGSLLLTMVLHGVANLVATLEIIVGENWLR